MLAYPGTRAPRTFAGLAFRRHTSTKASTYHPKVRALPFRIGKEQAIKQCSEIAMRYTMRPRTALEGLTAISRLAVKEAGSDVPLVRPDRIEAAYLPLWMIDAEVGGCGQPRPGSHVDRRECVVFLQSFFPGHHYDPLCKVFLDPATSRIGGDDVRKFDLSLAYHDGEEVKCIPYSTTPLVLPEILRTMPTSSYSPESEDAVNDDEDRTDFRRIFDNVHLFAAYPVLLPVYIMLYRKDYDSSASFDLTVVLQAHMEDGRIFYDTDEVDHTDAIVASAAWSMLCSTPLPETSFRKPGSACFIQALQATDMKFAQCLQRYMNMLLDTHRAITSVAQQGVTDMDDARIRVVTQDELDQNRQWMRRGGELAAVSEALHGLGDASTIIRHVRHWMQGQQMKGVVNENNDVVHELEGMKIILEEWRRANKPLWFTEWEEGRAGESVRK